MTKKRVENVNKTHQTKHPSQKKKEEGNLNNGIFIQARSQKRGKGQRTKGKTTEKKREIRTKPYQKKMPPRERHCNRDRGTCAQE